MKSAPPAFAVSLSSAALAIVIASCTPAPSDGGASGGRKGNGGSGQTGSGGAGTPGSGGSSTTGSGGTVGPGSGGNTVTGSGGTVGPGSGGSTTGSGGSTGSGGTGTPGTGGSTGSDRAFPTQACTDKASALLAMMTADEKIAQMHQVERKYVTAADITQYSVGSVYSEGGSGPTTNTPAAWADMIDGFRRAAFSSRLKIPIFYGLDSVHGAGPVEGATVFPHNVGLGATRDAALVEEVAAAAAEETVGVGADFPFAPVLAVARDERWGRTYESFGEMPDLVSSLGTAYVRGMQRRTGRILALGNAKHYVGDGGTANGVNNGDTSGNDATLRTIHLEPFRPALAAGLASVMASYSSWQGTRMHANKMMLTDVLKGQLGFKGFVGSDYNACWLEGVTPAACLDAGVDMFMTSVLWTEPATSNDRTITPAQFLTRLRPLVASRQARVDDAVRRILTVKCEMGLFDTAMPLVNRTLTGQVGSAAHRMVARRAVRASMVLLKNENAALPIAKTATVALSGKSADHAGNQCGGWTIGWQGAVEGAGFRSTINGVTTIRQAMNTVVGAGKVLYSADGANRTGASVGVVVTGETPYSEGCGDVPSPQGGTSCIGRPTSLSLSSFAAADIAALQAFKSAGLKTVLVLVVGRPVIIDTVLPMADAVIVAWLPGSEGAGVTDVLFGDTKPTGKLPHSWPRTQAQIPVNMGDATYDPLFPYGHGLGYP